MNPERASGDAAMTRTLFCRKYQEELEGLDAPPLPGSRRSAASSAMVKSVSWPMAASANDFSSQYLRRMF